MGFLQYFSLFKLLLLCSSINQAFSAPVVEIRAPSSPTVTIASGVIIGTTLLPSNQPSVTVGANAYLGVPFAKSPPERFSPPEAAPSWSSPLQAQARKPACVQQFSGTGETRERSRFFFNNPLGPPPDESEDCLYLNIYTPPGVTPNSKKAVMFWLFGGNLQFGNGGLDFYNGSSLATTQDVVVVTINYRTNIFGFSNSPEIPFGKQNSGFLDQRFALQWVQDNIAQFGGDPSRVMIYGESAGGESVKQLLANPPSPVPFSSAILQSEQGLIPGNGLLSFKRVLLNFKCSGIACLRTIPAADIKAYIEKESLGFPPVNDDRTSTTDVRPNIESGRWPKIPVMLGSNLNEARVFLAVAGLNDGPTALKYAFAQFNITSTLLQDSILGKYTTAGITAGIDVADRILTDLIFTCTTSSLANFLAKNGHTTYRYRYDGVFPSVSTFSNAGAYHTAEIPEVFGTYPLESKFGKATQQQKDLSAFMQKTWANFAKNASAGVGWPSVDNLDLKYDLGVLGKDGSSGVTVRPRIEADYACPLYAAIEDAAQLSYR